MISGLVVVTNKVLSGILVDTSTVISCSIFNICFEVLHTFKTCSVHCGT